MKQSAANAISHRPQNPVSLRGTQELDKARLYRAVREGYRRILFVAGCGYGKTVQSASWIFDLAVLKGQKVLFVVPAVSLIAKTLETFQRYDIPVGVIHRDFGRDRDETLPCQITLWQTLQNQWPLDWFAPDVVVLDECHEVCFTQWSLQLFPKLNPLTGRPYALADLKLALECLGTKRPRSLAELEKLHAAKLGYYADDEEAQDRLGEAWQLICEQQHLLPPHSPEPQPAPYLVGLTATPFRSKPGEYLGQIFQTQILTPTPGELVRAKQLVGCTYFEAGCPDLTGVNTLGGDFNESQLSRACNTPEANAAIVRGYLKCAAPEGRTAFCFAVDVAHVLALTKAFKAAGVAAVGITAKTRVRQREQWFGQLARGKLQVIVNRDTCYRGVDVDSVSCIILGRPTLSPTVHVQQVGRGMRICDDPAVEKVDCLVLDFAGNVDRHGRIEELTYPDLQEGVQQSGKSRRKQSLKECPSCKRLLELWATLCPHCLQDLTKPHLVPTGELTLVLSDLDKERYDYYRQQLQVAYQQKFGPQWALRQLQRRYQAELRVPTVWGRHAVFGPSPTREQMQDYRQYLERVCHRLHQKDPKDKEFRRQFLQSALVMEFGDRVDRRNVALPAFPKGVGPNSSV